MEEEEWTCIDIAPNYLVSTFGRVKKSDTGRILKSHIHHKGRRPVVHLVIDGVYQQHRVDVLVANAFVPGGAPDHKVINIDGDKTNCRADNLQWVPRQNEETAYLDRNKVVRRFIIHADGTEEDLY